MFSDIVDFIFSKIITFIYTFALYVCMDYKKNKQMRVSDELINALKQLGTKKDTYESVIWSLIVANNSCSCDESGVGPHVSKGKRSGVNNG